MSMRGILSALAVLCFAVAATAATLVVDLSGAGQYTAIQPAIDAAAEGDIVLVKPGEYVITEPITFKGRGITVRGERGAEATAVRMAEAPADSKRASVVLFENGETSTAVLEGFTLTGGKATSGANDAKGGGVHFRESSSPTLTGCTITGNSARDGGGVHCESSACPTLTNCAVTGNSGTYHGGGVYCGKSSSATLTSCTITGNSTRQRSSGGGVYCAGASSATLTGCTIAENSAEGGSGGGVYCADTSSVTLTSCTITGNSSRDGGGGVSLGSGTLTNCTITGNSTEYGGGGVSVGSGTLTSCSISGNSGGVGGAVDCQGSASLTDCSISGNSGGVGGGVSAGGSPTLTNCTITGNRASSVWPTDRGGGGVYCYSSSSPTLTNCTITGNSADDSGGGLCCEPTSCPTLMKCVITGNWARDSGGGVYCRAESSPTLANCTITGNSTDSGGGVYCERTASPALTNCTLTGNSAEGSGGGVYCDFSTSPILTSCIVWGNIGGAIVGEADSSPSVTYCCIEAEPVWVGDGNINRDPLFSGWDARGEVWVDPAQPAGGDGSEGNPYADVREATASFRLALLEASPCIGSGKDGTDMGADAGRCEDSRGTTLVVHLAGGTYNAGDFDLVHSVSLVGAGEENVIVKGTLSGLRTGTLLSGLTVIGGTNGGIRILAGDSPQISDCTIMGNTTDSGVYGGGVHCDDYSSPTLTNCTITGNSSSTGGGVYCDSHSSPMLANCRVTGNSASGGGGVYCTESSSPTFTNCIIAGNSARYGGGGVYCYGASPTLANCTITENSVEEGGGGVYCGGASLPTMINCIVWEYAGGAIVAEASSPRVIHSCIEGTPVWPGEGNINRNPRFVVRGRFEACDSAEGDGCVPYKWDPDTKKPIAWQRWLEGDFHLKLASPCLDAGSAAGAPASDLDGNARPCGSAVDMGAYELSPCTGDLAKFTRGDANSDARVSIADAMFCVSYIFGRGVVPECRDAADANDDGKVDIADAVGILRHLFTQAGPLPAPFGECALDPTPDDVPCLGFTPCRGL